MAVTINGLTGLTFNNGSTQDVGGVGTGSQTWQDVGATRVAFTTYTNTTGKPISVQVNTVNANAGVVGSTQFYIDNLLVAYPGEATNRRSWVGGIVPNGSTYYITLSLNSIVNWLELR